MRLNIKSTSELRQRGELERAVHADPDLQTLLHASEAQIDAWVDRQVTDLEDVKALLKRVLKVLAVANR